MGSASIKTIQLWSSPSQLHQLKFICIITVALSLAVHNASGTFCHVLLLLLFFGANSGTKWKENKATRARVCWYSVSSGDYVFELLRKRSKSMSDFADSDSDSLYK